MDCCGTLEVQFDNEVCAMMTSWRAWMLNHFRAGSTGKDEKTGALCKGVTSNFAYSLLCLGRGGGTVEYGYDRVKAPKWAHQQDPAAKLCHVKPWYLQGRLTPFHSVQQWRGSLHGILENQRKAHQQLPSENNDQALEERLPWQRYCEPKPVAEWRGLHCACCKTSAISFCNRSAGV